MKDECAGAARWERSSEEFELGSLRTSTIGELWVSLEKRK